MSISGTRVAYTKTDIQQAAQLANGCHQRLIEAAVTSLLVTRQTFLPASVTPLPDHGTPVNRPGR
jgi:hypothetical protein